MKRNGIVILIFLLLAHLSFAKASALSTTEQNIIFNKLNEIPKTRDFIFKTLFKENNLRELDPDFQNELEQILKVALIEADTQVNHLTSEIRKSIKLDSKVAAFHKQNQPSFNILISHMGRIKSEKTNEGVRKLKSSLFTHAHNVFVDDEEISSNLNTVILLFHELSHVAFDQMLTLRLNHFLGYLGDQIDSKNLSKILFIKDGILNLDGDFYDLFSERFAFELEFRIDRKFSKIYNNWPTFYRFDGVNENESIELIDGFTRRVYNIDHPILENLRPYQLDSLLIP